MIVVIYHVPRLDTVDDRGRRARSSSATPTGRPGCHPAARAARVGATSRPGTSAPGSPRDLLTAPPTTRTRSREMTRIDGSTALVTGGQRGLGQAFVEALLQRGATKVYATARKPTPSSDPRVET